MSPVNTHTAPAGGSKILVRLLCIAMYCCSLQLVKACPFFQKKIEQQQQQHQHQQQQSTEGGTTATTEEDCTYVQDEHTVPHNRQVG